MIPNAAPRELTTSGITDQAKFGISIKPENQAAIMEILRDTMYSDRILAVLREYGANSWDSHRMSGIPDQPIEIQIPTELAPELVIRDRGKGMSKNDMLCVFTQYGDSTKRETDLPVGCLGIGCKSGFAYSDSFTVTSWHKGTKTMYAAVLDEENEGGLNLLLEEPCGDETGFEVRLSVEPGDVYSFQRKATNLFQHFDPQPKTNLNLPTPVHRTEMPSGYLNASRSYSRDTWIARMGCVPYRLDVKQVKKELEALGIWDVVYYREGTLKFEIGEVQHNAAREELKYTAKTKKAVASKFQSLFQELVADLRKTVYDKATSDWEKRLKAAYLIGSLDKLAPELVSWTDEDISIYEDKNAPSKFTATRYSSGRSKCIRIDEDARVIIKDDGRTAGDFETVSYTDMIVTPVGNATVEEIRKELDGCLKTARLTGLPIILLSSLVYSPYTAGRGSRGGGCPRTVNKKHTVRSFKIIPERRYAAPFSQGWEIEKREPTDEDVFVILFGFQAVYMEKFYERYIEDAALAKKLGLKMPEIYGYKTSANKTVTIKDCKGTHYAEWRKTFFANAITPKIQKMLEQRMWAEIFMEHMSFCAYRMQRNAKTTKDYLKKELGEHHLLTHTFTRYLKGSKHGQGLLNKDHKFWNLLLPLHKVAKSTKRLASEKAWAKLEGRYPLLLKTESLSALLDGGSELWIEYIKLVDRDRENSK